MTPDQAAPKADPKTAARFEALLPRDIRLVTRPMFGHKAAFINGHMCAGTFGSEVFVRLDERSRSELLAIAGARPFEPMKGRPMAEYVVLPAAWVARGHEAAVWIARAVEWTATFEPKARRKRTSSTAGPRRRTSR